ncbi:MAG TPA: SCO family protein [Candidatus Acidoferrales bacterium]|nr:SCO family protein [Candidatus Acidoferrales bacterium]
MKELSRRDLLGAAAMTPLAALLPRAAVGAARNPAPGTQEYARKRIQQLHLPNVPLLTHEGKRVRFYDDLVKNKIVTLNFFYSKCDEICPTVTANLAKVQKLLGDRVGRQIFMYSFTLKPDEDTVEVIRHYREMFDAKPGWTFLTGEMKDLEQVRKGIGFTYPEPAIDKDKTQHIGNVRYGNEPLMLWGACPGMAHVPFIAESILWMIRPETQAAIARG